MVRLVLPEAPRRPRSTSSGGEFSVSTFYGNVTRSKRVSLFTLSSIEKREVLIGNTIHLRAVREYRKIVEAELHEVCAKAIDIIDKDLLTYSCSYRSWIFRYKI